MRNVLAVLAALALTGSASAQSVTTAFEGFSGRSDEPVNVEADNLEVREKEQSAIFSGNVIIKQGQSTLKSRQLTIFYYADGQGPKDAKVKEVKKPDAGAKPGDAAKPAAPAPAAPAADAGGGGTPSGRDIRRLEAEGDVTILSKNQRATGERGIFDMPSNTVTLTGKVVVTQGDSVIRGDRLHVDLNTQRSRIESAAGGGRVQGVFRPAQRTTPPAAGGQGR